MKVVSKTFLTFAIALLVSGVARADDLTAPTPGLNCVWGIAGFGADPAEIMGVYQIFVPFKGTGQVLSDSGKGITEEEEDIKIVSKPAVAGETYSFSVDRGSAKPGLKVTVSKSPFTGKFSGLSTEAKKSALASTALMSSSGSDYSLPGFCVIIKANR